VGAPKLQRPIRNAKAARSPLKTPVFHVGRVLNSNFLGGTADVLEPGTEDNSSLDRLPEFGIQPNHLVRLANWALFRRNVANCNGFVRCTSAHQPGYNLLQLTDITRIFSSKKIFTYGGVKLGHFVVRMSLTEEMFSERNDIFEPFVKRWQFAYETRDSVKEISAKLTAIYHFQKIAIGSTHKAKRCSVPCAPANTLVAAFLNNTQQLCLEGQRQFPNFVEKQGAAVCQCEGPEPLRHRTRERPALMPKEFTAGQLRYNGGTIQNHELALVWS
jgi:hypothetical protein